MTYWDPRPQLRQIEAIEKDGRKWYPLQAVCRAFRCDSRKAVALVDKSHKRREFVYMRGFRSRHICYVDRGGVETLCLRFGQIPRALILEALQ